MGASKKIVKVWPRGYAADPGPAVIVLDVEANEKIEAIKRFGACCRIISVRPEATPPVASVSESHARYMTMGDNT